MALADIQSISVLLSRLSSTEMEALSELTEVRKIKEGDRIIQLNVKPTYIAIIASGAISVGNPKIQNLDINLTKGDVIGDIDFFVKKPLSYTAVAVRASKVLIIPYEAMYKLNEERSFLAFKLYQIVARSASNLLQKLFIKGAGPETFKEYRSVTLQEAKYDIVQGAQKQFSTFGSEIPKADIQQICNFMFMSVFKQGERILKSGQQPSSVLILLHGSVEARSDSGRVLGYKNPGDLIGEEGFVATLHQGEQFSFARSCDIFAHTNASLAVLTHEKLDELTDANPGLSYRLQRYLTKVAIKTLQQASKAAKKHHDAELVSFGGTSEPEYDQGKVGPDLTKRASYFNKEQAGGEGLPPLGKVTEAAESPAPEEPDASSGKPSDGKESLLVKALQAGAEAAEAARSAGQSAQAGVESSTGAGKGAGAAKKGGSKFAKFKAAAKLAGKSKSTKKSKKAHGSKFKGSIAVAEQKKINVDIERLRRGSVMKVGEDEERGMAKEQAFDLLQQAMQNNPVLSTFETGEIRVLSRQMDVIRVRKGDGIMKEGEAASFFALMLGSGAAVIHKGKVVKEVPEGELVGELALFVAGKRYADVVAMKELSVAVFEFGNLETFTESMPELGLKLLRALAYSGLVHVKQDTQGESEFSRFGAHLQDSDLGLSPRDDDAFTYKDNPLVMLMMEAFPTLVGRRQTLKELHALKKLLTFVKLEKGECVLRRGQVSTCALIVLDGKLETFNDLRDSTKIGSTTVGDFVGETAILQDETGTPMLRRCNTYVGSESAVVAVVTFDRLLELNAVFPTLAHEIFQGMAEAHITRLDRTLSGGKALLKEKNQDKPVSIKVAKPVPKIKSGGSFKRAPNAKQAGDDATNTPGVTPRKALGAVRKEGSMVFNLGKLSAQGDATVEIPMGRSSLANVQLTPLTNKPVPPPKDSTKAPANPARMSMMNSRASQFKARMSKFNGLSLKLPPLEA